MPWQVVKELITGLNDRTQGKYNTCTWNTEAERIRKQEDNSNSQSFLSSVAEGCRGNAELSIKHDRRALLGPTAKRILAQWHVIVLALLQRKDKRCMRDAGDLSLVEDSGYSILHLDVSFKNFVSHLAEPRAGAATRAGGYYASPEPIWSCNYVRYRLRCGDGCSVTGPSSNPDQGL